MSRKRNQADAVGDVFRGQEVVELATSVPILMQGEALQGVAAGVDTHSYRVPLGVCGSITPFNFPAMCPILSTPRLRRGVQNYSVSGFIIFPEGQGRTN